MLTIRAAKMGDLGAITGIYNEAILTTSATFDTQPKTDEEQRTWFNNHGVKCPVVAAELDSEVVGWVSLSEWSDRCAYSDTAEISMYVKQEFRGKGIGRQLLQAIVAEGEKVGFHTILARINTGNDVSIHLHQSVGFEQVGIMREVGRKFGKLLDICLLQKIYPAKTPEPLGNDTVKG